MKIFDATQIKAWDAATIKNENISSLKLMERAAKACSGWIENELLSKSLAQNHRIHIFCGPGNNGGDGLAIARLLTKKKRQVKIFLVKNENPGSKDFEKNLSKLRKVNNKIQLVIDPFECPRIEKNDLVIDAIFGSGLQRPVEDVFSQVINCINECNATVVSIDLPSGMYINASSKFHPVVKATYTLSFQNHKLAFLMPENEIYTGTVHLIEIGLDKSFESEEPAKWELVEKEFIQSIYRPRENFSHKGNYGHALLVAGSYGKTGAAVLAAKGCLRSGIGLLTVHVPQSGYLVIQSSVPEAMTITGGEISYYLYQAAGIGPGCGTTEESKKLISSLLRFVKEKELKIQLVFDADALNILAADKRMLQMLPAGSILTPHPKEFARLFGESKDNFNRIETAQQKAVEFNCFIILKGHRTAVFTPEGKIYFNSTGNAGMATGGSGDVLTGIITGLAAQNYPAEPACLLGVYLHGLAGEIASQVYSQEAMIAGDIPECLGRAFQTLNP